MKDAYERELDGLGKKLAESQRKLGEQNANLARWQEAEGRMNTRAKWRDKNAAAIELAEIEFDSLASITGVQDIEILDKGLSMVVFVRVPYEGEIYDVEDWRLNFWPGQKENTRHGYGSVSILAHCLRITKPPDGDYYQWPRYRYGEYDDRNNPGKYLFCFGGHWPMLNKAIDANNYVGAAHIAVSALHFSQADNLGALPRRFNVASEGLVDNLADQLAKGGREVQKRYEKRKEAYVKFRTAHIGGDVAKNIAMAEECVAKIKQRLEELGREIARREEQLDEVENRLRELGNDNTDFESEFMSLLNLRGVSTMQIKDDCVVLAIRRIIHADEQQFDLGLYKLYLGPNYTGKNRTVVSPALLGRDIHAPPFRLVRSENGYHFDFVDAEYDIDEAIEAGDIVTAARYAVQELFRLKPQHVKRLRGATRRDENDE